MLRTHRARTCEPPHRRRGSCAPALLLARAPARARPLERSPPVLLTRSHRRDSCTSRLTARVAAIAALLTAACSASPSTPDGGASTTYHEHVAPIFTEHCIGCHSAGNIAPFALDNADAAQRMAAAIRTAVTS